MSVHRFEHHRKPLASRGTYYRRIFRYFLFSLALIIGSLMIGMAGYHWLGDLGWIDSLLNASMILTGMGPVDHLESEAGKIFASVYALYSGVAFLSIAAVFFAPMIHRFLHRLNIPDEE